MKKITPSLWFDNNAEEEMNFYTSVFGNSKIIHIERYQMNQWMNISKEWPERLSQVFLN